VLAEPALAADSVHDLPENLAIRHLGGRCGAFALGFLLPKALNLGRGHFLEGIVERTRFDLVAVDEDRADCRNATLPVSGRLICVA
jgi:hypothetical protein